MNDFLISPQTRAHYAPSNDYLNISMDFNAAPSGTARGTEVIIPDNAPPEVRAAAERYNQMVYDFAIANGISDYPIRGVRTTSENGRGVSNTVHVEPFFNSDMAMQEAIKANPGAFAEIYRAAFGQIPNARLIAPHGVGADRGAASSIFGDETSYGELMANTLLGQESPIPPTATRPQQSEPTNALAQLMTQAAEAPQEPKNALAQFTPEKSRNALYSPAYRGLDPNAFINQRNQLAQMGFDANNPYLRSLT